MCLQAIARKLHEKEMKEERRRQKQLEANIEEEYFEDHGGGRSTAVFLSLDLFVAHLSLFVFMDRWILFCGDFYSIQEVHSCPLS